MQAEIYEELDTYYNPTADLVLIEHHVLNQYFQYETIIKALNNRYKKQIATYHQERKELLIKLVDKMPEGNVTIETQYTVVKGDYMSEKPDNSTYNLNQAKFGGGFAGTGGTQTGGIFYDYSSSQNLTEAAAEIQRLLKQLDQSYKSDTTIGKMTIATEAIKRIESDPTVKERVLSALKAGGTQALAQLLNHPAASFVIGALDDWEKTKD